MNILEQISNKENQRLFIVLMLIQIVAYSTFMRTNIFTGDDWNFAYNGYAQLNGAFMLGRWFSGLIWMSLDMHSFAPVLSHLFAFSMFSLAGIFLVRAWKIESVMLAGIVAAMIVVFPFNSDIITFHIRHFTTTSGVFLSILGAYFLIYANGRVKYFFYACAALVLSFAIYQPNVSNVLAVILFFGLFRLLEGDSDKDVFRNLSILMLVILASVVLYFISFKISLELTGVDIARKSDRYNIQSGNVKSIGAIVENVKSMLAITKDFFTHRTQFFPLITKQILIILMLYVMFMVAIRNDMNMRKKIFSLVILLGVFVAPWSISLIREDFAARASMLYSFAIIYAGVIVFAYRLSSRVQVRKIIIAASVFLIVVFTFQMTKSGYYREMQWMLDNNIASRIMMRIEDKGLTDQVKLKKNHIPIYMYGRIIKKHRPFNDDIPAKEFFTNTSRDGVTDKQVIRIARLMNLHSAHKNFITVKKHQLRRSTKEKIRNMPKWPEDGSVAVVDGIVVVNMGNRKIQL